MCRRFAPRTRLPPIRPRQWRFEFLKFVLPSARNSLRRVINPVEPCRGPTTACRRPAAVRRIASTKFNPRPQRLGQVEGLRYLFHDPCAALTIAGPAGQSAVGFPRIGRPGPTRRADPSKFGCPRRPILPCAVEPNKSHAAGKAVRFLLQDDSASSPSGRSHYVLGGLTQGDFDKRSDLHAHVEQVGHQAEDVAEWAVGLVSPPWRELLSRRRLVLPGGEPVLPAPRRVRPRRYGAVAVRSIPPVAADSCR